MSLDGLVVVIPHSGIVIPPEVPLDCLSDEFPTLVQNVDWYTNWLYGNQPCVVIRRGFLTRCLQSTCARQFLISVRFIGGAQQARHRIALA